MKKQRTLRNDGSKTVAASLLSILMGVIFGGILLVLVALFLKMPLASAWEGFRIVLAGIFNTGRNYDAGSVLTFGFNPRLMGDMLFRSTPLIMTGLSVALAYKTGLFNIGAPGQYLMGTAASIMVALAIDTSVVPAALVWLLAFLAAVAAGALWGCIPGIVKAFLNINEVLACIMTNWIAANLVTWFFDATKVFQNTVENTKSGYIYKTAYGRTLVDGVWTYVDGNGVQTAKLGLDKLFPGSQVNGGILIAILIAVGVYILMTKTTLGYQLKACGSNRHAARYAGVNDKRNIVLSMAIAGALSGAGAALYCLAGNTEFFWSTYQALPATGFNGIPVALLAANHPVGVIFTGCFMSMLNIVGLQLTNLTAYNEYITDVIISVIVYLSAFSLVIKMLLDARRKGKKEIQPVPERLQENQAEAEAPTEKGGEQA